METVSANRQTAGRNKHTTSNGHGPTGVHKNAKAKASSSNHGIEHGNGKIVQDETEDKQMKKVMEGFLKSIRSMTGRAEEIRQESRRRFQEQTSLTESRTQATDSSVNAQNDEPLLQMMSGKFRGPRRHKSDASLVSSDSADSEGRHGTFHRTKSFTMAQRKSMVAALQQQEEVPSQHRRCSEDIRQTLYAESSLPDATDVNTNGNKAGSSVVHTRASSDPVNVVYDTTATRKPSKDKEKKSWLKNKFFKKKKDSSKQKDDSKDSMTFGDAATTTALYSGHGPKVAKSNSDKRTTSSEGSAPTRRRTPSPPGSPKRTPNLIRRFSSRKKKISKSDQSSSWSSSRDHLKTSRDSDIVGVDGDEVPNSDPRSNSLPMDVKFSTKPTHDHKKHGSKEKDEKMRKSDTVVGGSLDHPGKGGRKSREVQRPNTLDIARKKTWRKRIKKIFLDSDSSSSDEMEEKTEKRDTIQSSFPTSSERERKNYQHRATKSMGDMYSQDKSLTDIGEKLKKVAEAYSQLYAQQYVGPTGRTHTPDSYRQEMNRTHARPSPVSRSTSHTPSSGTKVSSHAMKAFYNMAEASRPKGQSETGSRRSRSRITRDEISYHATGSFDSPQRGGATRSWSDRVQTERLQRSENRFQDHQRKESPVNRRHADLRSNAPPRTAQAAGVPPPPASSHHSPSHHQHRTSRHPRSSRDSSGPPAPTMSISPNLRSSRSGRYPQSEVSSRTVAADSFPTDHHIHRERHVDRTITAHSASHSRTVHVHRDIVDDVETDALPSTIDDVDDSVDYDIAMALNDDDVDYIDEYTETTTTVTEEVDGLPLASAGMPRAATMPSSAPTDGNDLDADDVDDEIGAVGGEEEIDEDKLVSRIVEALCKKGDEIEKELDTPQLESSMTNLLSTMSKEKAKEIVERALNKIQETTRRFTHPEIIQLAMLFNMAGLFGRLASQPSFFEGVLQSFIKPIINRLGGWSSDALRSSLDETLTEQEILDKEGPSTSGLNRHNKHRRDSDTDGELD